MKKEMLKKKKKERRGDPGWGRNRTRTNDKVGSDRTFVTGPGTKTLLRVPADDPVLVVVHKKRENQKKFRKNPELIARAKLLISIMLAYVLGAVFSGLTYYKLEFRVFYVICICLLVVIGYDFYKINIRHFRTEYRYYKIFHKPTFIAFLYYKIHNKDEKRTTSIGTKNTRPQTKLAFGEK